MTDFPYGRVQNAYLNVKEAAKEPWRGITAWVQGSPYLVIDKDEADRFVLEGEDGQTLILNSFEKWEPATEQSALIAASRAEGSPFAQGAKVGTFVVGNLVYFQKEWSARVGDSGIALPLERLVARYDRFRWDKNADMYPTSTYRCPQCGSDNISGVYHSSLEPGDKDPENAYCEDCGYEGPTHEFLSEEPDYDRDIDPGFYEDWNPLSSSKTAASFEYNLPPAGIHMRTHGEMQNQGLQARVHYPPGVDPNKPEGWVTDVPGPGAMDDMFSMMHWMDQGINPEDIRVHVETPHDPNVIREIFDRAGGRHMAKVADQQEGMKCPNCGSHTIRAFTPAKDQNAQMVCLTCGHEFARKVFKNPESKVAVAPIDQSLSAEIAGLTQMIQQAYQQGDHRKAQQLNQRLMQLLDNPNNPQTGQTPALTGFSSNEEFLKEANKWIKKRGDQWCIIQKGTGKELSCHDSEEKAQASFRAMEMHKHQGALVEGTPEYDEFMDRYANVLAEAHKHGLHDAMENPDCPICGEEFPHESPYYEDDMRSMGSKDDCPCGGDCQGECQDCGCGGKEAMIKEAPGKEHMKGVSPKRNRQYEDILRSCRETHPDYSEERCKELAARTVNKQRREKGETKSKVDNSKLTSTVENFFLESMTFDAAGYYDNSPDTRALYDRGNQMLGPEGYDRYLQPDVYLDDDQNAMGFCRDCGYELGPEVHGECPHCGSQNIEEYAQGDPYEHAERGLRGGSRQAWYDGADDPYPPGPHQVDLDQYQKDEPALMADDSSGYDYAHCPACDGPGVLLGQLGNVIHYRCRNCGVDFNDGGSTMNSGGDASGTIPGPPEDQLNPQPPAQQDNGFYGFSSLEDAAEVNRESLKTFKDSGGNDLVAGNLYWLRHPEHKVPDVVKILNLEESRIEAAIASDEHGAFPIHITHDDIYTLDPYEKKESKWTVVSEEKMAGPLGLFNRQQPVPAAPTSYEPGSTEWRRMTPWKERSEYYDQQTRQRFQQMSDDELLEWIRGLTPDQTDPRAIEELQRRGLPMIRQPGDRPVDPNRIGPGVGLAHIATRDFSAQEQRELIEENPEGRARNFDKLNLDGTHYSLDDDDPDFLLGL